MNRKAITAAQASTVGPYSHGIDAGPGELVYLSGQTPLDPARGALVGGGAAEQTRQCLRNLLAVLEAAGLAAQDVVKVNVYLTDMADFAEMNAAYAEHFAQPYPARTTVGVAALPLGARVEIELVARRPR
ncbi:2-iminobutanoate/2-iminopropanoate deaminase [Deinobacterium chartae]|uniref:2-iminobutanoate/2-iminopropanoate deaminase n=1 Tax=Deinobacterium chartae TaxID=521158 RepID=A0A841I474_9DEIO|nr:Rid family detoxifying hydrolase [Deinobacterium chartae]MBB6099198.1 2-iminobutanoate/2-iminopropanoate deaminase [Deinobacterium chartae]